MHPVSCGSPGVFVLTIAGDISAVRTIDAMAALVRRGMVVIDAKRAIEAVVERQRALVEVPMVEDPAALAADLAAAGFAAESADAALEPPGQACDHGQAA
jgi:hypothetical protein